MPRCYMVKKGAPRHEGPPPCSPTEASVAPPCYSPDEHSAHTEPRVAEYAELGVSSMLGRSAADTEAAHELLSLAQSVPPLPPLPSTTVVNVVPAPEPPSLVPIYHYTIQPANIFILADDETPVYHTVQTVTPVNIEYVEPSPPLVQPQLENQIQVQPEISYVEYQDDADFGPQSIETEYVIQQESSEISEPESEYRESETPPPPPPKRKEKSTKYNCNECGKRYATSSNLSRHKQTHRSLESGLAKRCGECGKAYVSMPALAMHVLTHRMGHVCGVCGKQFSRPWLLRGHLRSHTGEKPYSCGDCGKAFADRSNLRAHLQTHTSDKKFQCGRCRKTFALRSYLNKHQEAACVRDNDE